MRPLHAAILAAAAACCCAVPAAPCRAAESVRAPAPAADAKAQLDGILGKPAYRRWERRFAPAGRDGSVTPQWLDNAVRGFQEWLAEKLFGRAKEELTMRPESAGSGAQVGGVFKALFWAVLGVVVLALGWMIWRLWRESRGHSPRAAATVSRAAIRDALTQGAALALDGEQWLEEADALARAGDFRLAWRALYLGLLSGLHGQGAIQYRRTRTNWAYVRDFRGGDDHRDSFRDLTGLFDEVWYGCRVPADAASRMPVLRGEVSRLIGPAKAPAGEGGAHA